MKRSHSENNLESDDNMNDAANSVNSGGGGSNASGGNQHSNNNNRGQKRNRNEEQIRLLIPSRVSQRMVKSVLAQKFCFFFSSFCRHFVPSMPDYIFIYVSSEFD